MIAFMDKMGALLLLAEGLEQICLPFERHRDCLDQAHELDWCCGVNTGGMVSIQACTFGNGAFALGADCFEHFLKVVRLSSIMGSAPQIIVGENINGTGS